MGGLRRSLALAVSATCRRARSVAKRCDGFSVLDLVVAMSIAAVLMTMGVGALRHHWHVRGLESSADELVTKLRELQGRTVAESHPLVYGARFSEGTSEWGVIRFDPKGAGALDDTCTQIKTQSLGQGLFASPATIKTVDSEPGYESGFCQTNLVDSGGAPISATTDDFVFFYARGTATRALIVLTHPSVEGRERAVVVKAITGRVAEL